MFEAKSYNFWMYLDGRRLHYFITVADLGSLGRASEVLHVAQPALSRQIRLLEEQVGVPLMERTARGMALTPAGRAYCQSARQLIDQGQRRFRAGNAGGPGPRRAPAPGHLGNLCLAPGCVAHAADVPAREPGGHLPDRGHAVRRGDERVLDGHLDLALATTGPLPADGPLVSAPWLVDEYRLAVNTASPLYRRPPRRLADLNGEDFVLFRRDQSAYLHDLMIHHFHQRGFSPHVVQEGTTHYTVLGLIAAGLGCSILPASAGQRLPPGVRLLRVPDLQLHVPVHLVWRQDRHTPVIQRFAELLAEQGAAPATADSA
jgi:DNA-binding transcriptional LysR family regulator